MKRFCFYSSPIGELLLVGSEEGLEEIRFPIKLRNNQPEPDWENDPAFFKEPLQQLSQYFSGRLKVFTIKLNPTGTHFQKKVWQELENVPFGQTASYAEIAKRLNNPKACRAVGGANGKNPTPIIVPCHRIIGKDGSLTGFGGGLDVKEFLLQHEKELMASQKARSPAL